MPVQHNVPYAKHIDGVLPISAASLSVIHHGLHAGSYMAEISQHSVVALRLAAAIVSPRVPANAPEGG
jgi:hypothetical protein